MTTQTLNPPAINLEALGGKALRLSAQAWFVVAAIGQMIFATYIFAIFGGAIARGEPEAWNPEMIHGFIPGDTMGNVAVAMHILLAFIITVGGPLQLIPKVRQWTPRFHRLNGRVYMVTALLIAVDGLYMIWTRGTLGGLTNHISISINAILIIVCGIMAWRHAVAGRIAIHRRWALRLFLMVSGVWFFRLMFMGSIFAFGSVGHSPTLEGWLDITIGFANYLVPLAILEVYLRARDKGSAHRRLAVAGLLFVLAGVTAFCVFAATAGMWLPAFS